MITRLRNISDMTSDLNIYSPRSLRALMAIQRDLRNEEFIFCTKDNLEESLSTLSEELEAFDISAITMEGDTMNSIQPLKDVLVKLINVSWQLIHKNRELMRSQDQHQDAYCKVTNENTNLKKHVKRIKEDLQKEQHILLQTQERERRLKVQCENMSRDLKHEKDEVLKLKKQLQSKDNQHEHELRRVMQNGHKLREQLQKSIGTYVPRDKVLQNLQANHEKEMLLYKQSIHRLEENNRLMLQEINDLKDALSLHSTGTELQVEASGSWDDAET